MRVAENIGLPNYYKNTISETENTPGLMLNNPPKKIAVPPAESLTKEILISLTPIYGTIHEFEKGNIGWGIFSAITDVLSLAPIVGTGIKALSAGIRMAKIAAISERAVWAAGKVGVQTSRLPAALRIADAGYQGASTFAPNLVRATARAFDPGVELAYHVVRYGIKDIAISASDAVRVASKVGKIPSAALKTLLNFVK